MSEAAQYSGLCSTCKKATDCSHLKNATQAVMMCNEFESIVGPADSMANGETRTEIGISPRADNERSDLCASCKKIKDCTHPKPAEGIWRCDEYA